MSNPEFWATVTTQNLTGARAISFHQELQHHTPAGVSRVVHTLNVADSADDEDVLEAIELGLQELAERGIKTVRHYQMSGDTLVERTDDGDRIVVADD